MPRRNSFGIAIIEMMTLLAVLGALLVVSTYIIVRANAATSQANAARIKTERFDGMINSLRRDVWGSHSISAGDSTVELSAGGEKITWTFTENRATRAESSSPARTWEAMPAIAASAERAMLRLRIKDADETAEVLLPSQVLQAGAAK
jgi:hypothetical protein